MRRPHLPGGLATAVAVVLLWSQPQAKANLVINATFDSSITSLPGAAAIEGAINAAVLSLEAAISTNVTVAIDFKNMTSGLGESSSFVYNESYFAYYNALAAAATTPAQLAAIASLGAAPTSAASGNPVTGSTSMTISGPLGRALGFNTSPGAGQFDTVISLNTSITSPPNGLPGNYGLQAVATHELDEALGAGGLGSFLGTSFPVGPLDLFRYSAPGVRSFTTNAGATAYFSIDGGNTVLSYFNQVAGADYGDWKSAPDAPGFPVQVQDAFGSPGTNPALGVNELTSLNVIGWGLTTTDTPPAVPEPSTVVMLATALVFVSGYGWSRRTTSSSAPETARADG
jgi:hypothetical protein